MNKTLALDNVTELALRLPPLDQVKLIERLMPAIERELATPEAPAEALAAWQQVYANLTEEEMTEVERIATDRGNFMRQEP